MSKDKKENAEIDLLQAQLKEAEEKAAKLEKELAEASKPSKAKAPGGVKLIIKKADRKANDGHPAEGSDGQGNLIKYAPEAAVKGLIEAGWSKA